MIGWLALATVFAFGAAQDADAPGAVPPMEIHLRQADAIDLLFVLASVHNSPMVAVRPATDVRVTYEHEHILPAELRKKLGAKLDLRGTRAGDFEAWVPVCAKPEYHLIDFPVANRLTMSFSDLPAGALLPLIADAEGAVHGIAPDDVELHEVGALDAIVDVVGVVAALHA